MKPFLLTVFLLQPDPSGMGDILNERFIGDYAKRPNCERAGAQLTHQANEAFAARHIEAEMFYICSGAIIMDVPRDLWPNGLRSRY